MSDQVKFDWQELKTGKLWMLPRPDGTYYTVLEYQGQGLAVHNNGAQSRPFPRVYASPDDAKQAVEDKISK